MNYIENILTDLGVKIGEEFNLKYSDGEFFSSNTYHFNDNFYLLRSWECEADFSESNAKILLLLLQGVLVIEKDDFNPVDGEIFYFPTLGVTHIQLARFDSNNLLHVLLKNSNMVYRSEKEVMEHFKEDYKTLTGSEYDDHW